MGNSTAKLPNQQSRRKIGPYLHDRKNLSIWSPKQNEHANNSREDVKQSLVFLFESQKHNRGLNLKSISLNIDKFLAVS